MPLQSFDIRKVWDTVRPGLEYAVSKTLTDVRPEDCYAACVAGRWHLFKPDAASSDFVLLAQSVSVYTGDAFLIVVAAYSKTGNAIDTYTSDIEAIARESGCKWIEFVSSRPGWGRHAKRHGFKPRHTLYRREL